MRNMSQHTEWLSMIEVSGPFLAVSVLEKVFPQNLEGLDTHRKRRLRAAYEQWCTAVEENDPQLNELHRAWISVFVLKELLEFEESVLLPVDEIEEYIYTSPDGVGQFAPDYIFRSSSREKPKLFISIFPEGTDLEKVRAGDGWPVPIHERMTLLCRAKDVRLGIITNGERWMLVNAPVGSTSSHISWYARLWFQEPVTLKAFQSLLGVRRWFGDEKEALPAMLEESLQHHEEVTDTLGEQVKRAVEVLVQCLDKADQDRNRELLHDVPPAELYEAGLTVMMRLVFVLCAEERGLLLLGDTLYDRHYATTTLRGQLAEEADQHGHEVLERRHDAWARLLALFRAVYGGIEHESLRMPALGGSLFDPDRFPFLEGRAKGTQWLDTPAQPLPIDNRTVLLLLEALLVLEQRGGALLLSYKALDVEQIGHVYEGLLEHTVRRLPKDTLGLIGSQKAKNPNLTLAELESARLDGEESLISVVENATQRNRNAIANALGKATDDNTFGNVVAVCCGDMEFAKRIKPFTNLLRTDAWGDFIVYRANSLAVTLGADRRETGTHYTPKYLTESIVKTTLEPVAYLGPAEGNQRDEWQLKSSAELLELKICDPAMGSGAFLVQVCRWLSERIVEAWGSEADQGKFITVDGLSLDAAGGAEPIPDSLDEQLLIARRLVAEKCLYGVDMNPLAVELAKLSIWLITLAKDRPFGFLDHNLRSGDSLLGLHELEQLTKFSLHPEKKRTISIFASNIEAAVKDALALRKKLRETPIRDIRDVQYMERLDQQARKKIEHIEHIADAMIGEALASGGNDRVFETAMDNLSILAAAYIEGDNKTGMKIIAEARRFLCIDLPAGKPPRKPFHWALEFPEVFERGGFEGIVGNPPFLGGTRISFRLGVTYLNCLYTLYPFFGNRADLVSLFFIRGTTVTSGNGYVGLIGSDTIAEGDTREVGLERILNEGNIIFNATKSMAWPGNATQRISIIHISKQSWSGDCFLNGEIVPKISSFLDCSDVNETANQLISNSNLSFEGAKPSGTGFVLTSEEAEELMAKESNSSDVIFPYLRGEELNSSPLQKPHYYVIDFGNRTLEKSEQYKSCISIIREKVKPIRDTARRKAHRERWWMHGELRPGLYDAIRGLDYLIVHAFTSKHLAFCIVPNTSRFAAPMNVFAFSDFCRFSVLQSNVHMSWALQYCSTMGTRIRYIRTDIFNTFPFPLAESPYLKDIGEKYFNFRKEIMVSKEEGLTSTYNKFNDEKIGNSDITKLRHLHMDMDRAVLEAYGWDDIILTYGFYETKIGIRFTLPDSTRNEIVKRLLKLNHERYKEEIEQGLHGKKTSNTRKIQESTAKNNGNMDLFDFMNVSPKESK